MVAMSPLELVLGYMELIRTPSFVRKGTEKTSLNTICSLIPSCLQERNIMTPGVCDLTLEPGNISCLPVKDFADGWAAKGMLSESPGNYVWRWLH